MYSVWCFLRAGRLTTKKEHPDTPWVLLLFKRLIYRTQTGLPTTRRNTPARPYPVSAIDAPSPNRLTGTKAPKAADGDDPGAVPAWEAETRGCCFYVFIYSYSFVCFRQGQHRYLPQHGCDERTSSFNGEGEDEVEDEEGHDAVVVVSSASAESESPTSATSRGRFLRRASTPSMHVLSLLLSEA